MKTLKLDLVKAGLVLLVLLLCPLAAAAADSWSDPGLVKVNDSDLSFSDQEFKNLKLDSIYFMSRFNGEHLVTINLFHYKDWYINEWGVHVMLVRPGKPITMFKENLDKKKIQFSTDRLFITDGVNTIQGTNRVCYVNLEMEGLSCQLKYVNLLNGWTAGTGWDYLSKDKKVFNYRVLPCPWARVSGTIEVAGEKIDVQGQGYADKNLCANPVTRTQPSMRVMRVYDAEETAAAERWHINFMDSISHKTYGSRRMSYLILARGGEWLLTTDDFTLTMLDFTKHESSGYEYPGRVLLESRDRGYSVTGEYTCEAMIDYLDILGELPDWLRYLVTLFFKRPVRFFFSGEFNGTVTMPDGSTSEITLRGPFSFMVIR